MSTATDLNSQAPQSGRGQRATQRRDDDVDDFVGTRPPPMPWVRMLDISLGGG
jgi:hypothetical protein